MEVTSSKQLQHTVCNKHILSHLLHHAPARRSSGDLEQKLEARFGSFRGAISRLLTVIPQARMQCCPATTPAGSNEILVSAGFKLETVAFCRTVSRGCMRNVVFASFHKLSGSVVGPCMAH